MFVLADRVKQNSISTGVGSLVFSETLPGYQSFQNAIGDGNSTYYTIENGINFEVGVGTYTQSTNSLSRDTVLVSSNSNQKISLEGLSIVFVTYPADRAAIVNNDGFMTSFDADYAGIKFPDGTTQITAGGGNSAGDTNYYVNEVSFDSSSNILTFGRTNPLSDITVDLSNLSTDINIPESGNWNDTFDLVSTSGSKWTEAYSWGDHANVGYLTDISIPESGNWNDTYNLVDTSGNKWAEAYSWGDHSTIGYLATINIPESGNWNDTYDLVSESGSKWTEAYSWGDHSSQGYLTDPYHPSISAANSVSNAGNNFIQSISFDNHGHVTGISTGVATAGGNNSGGIASLLEDTSPQLGSGLDANGYDIDMGNSSINFTTNTITDTKVGQWDSSYSTILSQSANWNTAYGWGDHSGEGYLTGINIPESGNWNDTYDLVTESGNKWTEAYSWGDHSTAGYLSSIGNGTATHFPIYDSNGTLLEDSILKQTSTSQLTQTGVRQIDFISDSTGFIKKKGDSGGWAWSVDAEGSSGSVYRGFGFYGLADALYWTWMGNSYNDPDIKTQGQNVGIGMGASSLSATQKFRVNSSWTHSTAGATNVYARGDYNTVNSEVTADCQSFVLGYNAFSRKDVKTGVTDTGYILAGDFTGVAHGAGTLTGSYGVRAYAGIHNGGTGTVTSAYGVRSRVLNLGDTGATITHGYGLYIDAVQATNSWGIYQVGTDNSNYFGGYFGIGTASITSRRVTIKSDGNDNSAAVLLKGSAAGTGTQEGFLLSAANDGTSYVWNFEDKPLICATNNFERIRIDENGKVGIGTSSPTVELNIDNSQSRLYQNATNRASFASHYFYSSGVVLGGLLAYGSDYSAGSYMNLGSGTFHLFSSYEDLAIHTGGVNKSIVFGTNTNSSAGERMRITGDGKVGIGTDNPTELLAVSGDAQINKIQIGSQAYSIGSHTQGITHVDYDDSQSYMIISDGDNTYTSCHNLSGFNYMRGPQNGTAYQVAVGNNYMWIGTNSFERMTIGSTETVFNQDASGVDFRIEGISDTNLLRVDASEDMIGIGHAHPRTKLHVRSSTGEGTVLSQTDDDTSWAGFLIRDDQDTNVGSLQFGNGGVLSPEYTHLRDVLFAGSRESGIPFEIYQGRDLKGDGTPDLPFRTNNQRVILNTSGDTILTAASGQQIFASGQSVMIPTESPSGSTMLVGRHPYEPSIRALGGSESKNQWMIVDSSGASAALNYFSNDNVLLAYGGGNVGIGTANPGVYRFRVVGGHSSFEGGNVQFDGGNVTVNQAGGNYDFRVEGETDEYLIVADANRNHVILAHGGGSVGIGEEGTSSNGAHRVPLSISPTGYAVTGSPNAAQQTNKIRVYDREGNGIAGLGVSTSSFNIATSGLIAQRFWTNSTERMKIDHDGKLEHYGTEAKIADGSTYELDISASAATLGGNRLQLLGTETVLNNAQTNVDFRVEGDTTERLLFCDASTDRVGIKSTHSPTEVLDVVGGLKTSGWITYSDSGTGTSTNGGVGVASGFNVKLSDTHGTTLQDTWHYIIRLTTTGTGTNTGSSYLVWYQHGTSTWIARLIGRSGSNTNHPQLAISGTNAVAYDEHSANYGIQYTVESYYTADSDGTPHSMGANYHWQRDVNDLIYTDGIIGVGASGNDPNLVGNDGGVHIAAPDYPEIHLTNNYTGHSSGDGTAIQQNLSKFTIHNRYRLGALQFHAFDASSTSKQLLELSTYHTDFNLNNLNCDFRVRGSTTDHLIYADASVDRLGVGTTTPHTKFHVSTGTSGGIKCTGGFITLESPNSNTSSVPYISVQGTYSGTDGTQVKIQSYETYGTLQSDNNSDPIALQPVDGNVGVHGVTAPAVPLHVGHDNNAAGIRVEDTSTGTYLEIGESAYTASNLYTGITHSEYTGSQEYMLLSAGSHTFVSAKTGYSSYIRAGGNSTTYQAIVQTNRFAIGSNADLLIVDSEGLKAKKNIYIDRYLESNIAVGWYTVAVNAASRACGRFGLACQSGSRHQGIIFYASHYYGAGNQISILHNEKYSSINPVAKIRIKEGGTYDGCLLQVYIDDAANTPEIFLLGDNINDTGWVVVDWVPDGTDPGTVANFSSLTNVAVEVNLDDVEFGTTGNSVFQGTVTCDSSVTASSLVKSGGTSSQFLKADGSVDTSTYLTSFTETDPVFGAHTVSNIANGTGLLKNNGAGTWSYDNSTYLTSVAFSDIAAAAIVTEAEGISSNDNDTTIPTSAAVKDYVDNNAGGSSNLIRGSFAVTTSTSVFTVSGGYNTGSLDVYQNGVKLFKGSSYDFTETGGGTTFTLANAATNGDLIEYVALNASTSATGNTSLGSVSVTTNQTVFNTSDTFTSSNLAVFLNGVKLVDGTDYNVTSSSQFTLTSTAVSGDVVEYIAYGATVASSNLAKTGDTMTGNLTVDADLIVTGYKETHTDNGNTGTAQTIDISDSTLQTYTLTGNCTFTMPTADAGRSFTMFLKTGAGSLTATFTGAKFPDNVAPTISTAANRMDILTFYSDGTNWYGSAQQEYYV